MQVKLNRRATPDSALEYHRERRLRGFHVILAILLFMTLDGFAAETNLGLSAGAKGELLLNGRPIRAVGVNYYDAFIRLLGDGKLGDLEAGQRDGPAGRMRGVARDVRAQQIEPMTSLSQFRQQFREMNSGSSRWNDSIRSAIFARRIRFWIACVEMTWSSP